MVCLQNHDQVGNRAKGDRLTTILKEPAQIRLAACLLLFAPHIPLLFMGEEYAEKNPFPFFCSFCGKELIEAVREGRKREFADFVDRAEEIPVPDAVETFESARLTWRWPEGSFQGGVRALYRDLLRVRREWPALMDFTERTSRLLPDEESGALLELVRGTGTSAVRIFFNLSEERQVLPTGGGEVVFSSEMLCYGGNRARLMEIHNLVAVRVRSIVRRRRFVAAMIEHTGATDGVSAHRRLRAYWEHAHGGAGGAATDRSTGSACRTLIRRACLAGYWMSTRRGDFRIAPVAEQVTRKQVYWPDTNVLVTRFLMPEGVVEVVDYMAVGVKKGDVGFRQLVRQCGGDSRDRFR